eukprot:9335022-Alexandrium_andersonii.AAC.1
MIGTMFERHIQEHMPARFELRASPHPKQGRLAQQHSCALVVSHEAKRDYTQTRTRAHRQTDADID